MITDKTKERIAQYTGKYGEIDGKDVYSIIDDAINEVLERCCDEAYHLAYELAGGFCYGRMRERVADEFVENLKARIHENKTSQKVEEES